MKSQEDPNEVLKGIILLSLVAFCGFIGAAGCLVTVVSLMTGGS